MSAGGAAAALPRRLGRYEVRALLGRGAMGAVYKARDPALDREVAVKTLGGALLEAEEHRAEYLERFHREARAAARLSHPNVVAVHDLGVDEATGVPFIVMELVPGVSLATLLRENPSLPVGQALEIADQVAAAIEEAHRHGIVHRDVKPTNVFVDPRGRVKVGDFGIARTLGSELTQAGVTLGTPGYLAPEVVRGGTADARADVFALGALTYALLAGQKPFLGVTPHALAAEVLERDPDPPHVVRPEVPPASSHAVMRALAKAPEARTASAAAFRRQLRGEEAAEATGGAPTGAAAAPTLRTMGVPTAVPPAAAPPTIIVPTAAPPGRRLPVTAIAIAVLLAALLAAWLGARHGTAPAGEAAASPAARTSPSMVPVSPRPRATPPPAVAQPPPAPPQTAGPAPERREQEPSRGQRGKPDKRDKGQGRGRGHAKGKKG